MIWQLNGNQLQFTKHSYEEHFTKDLFLFSTAIQLKIISKYSSYGWVTFKIVRLCIPSRCKRVNALIDPSDTTHIYAFVVTTWRTMHAYIWLQDNQIPLKKGLACKSKNKSYIARFKVHFDMSHDYGGPKFYKIVKHEQPGTGFWPMISIYIQFGIGHL